MGCKTYWPSDGAIVQNLVYTGVAYKAVGICSVWLEGFTMNCDKPALYRW